MKKMLRIAMCAILAPSLSLFAQSVHGPVSTLLNSPALSQHNSAGPAAGPVAPDVQMVNCNDVVTYADRATTADIDGWMGGASGFMSLYEVFPDFSGSITEIYVTAKKLGTASCPINITVHSLDISGVPNFNYVGTPVTATVTATSYTQYGGALSAPVSVTGGFAVCVWLNGATDSCSVRARTDADQRDLSYYDMGTSGTTAPLTSLGYDLDISLRPKIQFTAPTVSASANPTTACVGSAVNFSGGGGSYPAHYQFNDDCNIIYNLGTISPTYNWGFGDAGTSTLSSPSHSYAAAGNYNASVTLTYSGWTTGCSTAPGTTPVTVTGVVPSVSIAATATTVCPNDMVTFQATPTNGGTSPTYVWKKNGFQVGTGVSYTGSGWVYGDQMTCEMTSNEACASPTVAVSSPINMGIYPGSLSAFSYTSSALAATFTEQATNEVSYLWDFGDSQTGTAPSPIHNYAGAGVYTVQLTTTDQCGSTNASVLNVTITSSGNHAGSNVGIEEHTSTINASSYPNPAGDQLNVNYSLSQTADLTIEVLNSLGQVVSVQTVNNASQGTAEVSMTDMAAGMYYIRLTDGVSQSMLSVAHQ